MPGDYSRKTFDAKKHYSAVLEQQGRVQVDADWNEQADIQQYRLSTETTDVIGAAGVPKENDGFEIVPFTDGSDLTILPGRIYVDGILFELEPGVTTYLHQPHYPDPDIGNFSTSPSPPDSPQVAALKDGTYIVFFEGWQREINYHDDAGIQEVALGEADTTTRIQNVWQVKLLKVTDTTDPDCNTFFPEWNTITAIPTGKLNARVMPNTSEETPCVLPPGSAFSGLENQLYRVQILQGGDKNTATFTWSRDNGSVETNILKTFTDAVTVADIGKDDVLGFANGQWVEIIEAEPGITGGTLVQIDTIDPDLLKISFKTGAAIPAFDPEKNLKLRRWDVTGTDMKNGIPITDDWINIEGGIQVLFNNGNYEAGDHWLIPARTAIANIIWPFNDPQPPSGITRHYSKLGLIVAKSGKLDFIDCRTKFPTLTGICAEDICFNNINCDLPGATNVQEALDILCERSSGGSCTFAVSPREGWEDILDFIEDGTDAQICFQVGDYPLAKPLILKNKGNLKLEGCGAASRIISSNAEAAIVFDHCKTVTLRDLYAEGGIAFDKIALTTHLNGVFNFISCDAVNIDHVSVKSGTSDTRNCTCITVNNDVNTPGIVRIEDCDLQMANKQQGILVINTTNCWIAKNSLKVYAVNNQGFTNALGIKYLLASNTLPGPLTQSLNGNNATVSSNDFVVNFRTDSSLVQSWQGIFNTVYPSRAGSVNTVINNVKDLAKRIVVDQTLQNQFASFGAFVKTVSAPVKAIASQGITIGGQIAKNIYISENIITDALQGIHVGVSHKMSFPADVMENLSIRDNVISIALPVTVGKEDRYGIFAGNSNNVLIENNKLVLERLIDKNAIIQSDGIRVWGTRGPRLIISQNLIMSLDGSSSTSFSTGINVQPSIKNFRSQLWMVMFNVIYAKTIGISNNVSVQNQNNIVALAT